MTHYWKIQRALTRLWGVHNITIFDLSYLASLMQDTASILKCFAENTRLRILRLVSMQELAVKELVSVLSLPQPRVSRHLAVLRRAGLVQDRREGNWIYYRTVADELGPLAAAVWDAVRASLADCDFFPKDLTRLDETLAGREDHSRDYFETMVAEWDRVRRRHIDDALSEDVVAGLVHDRAVVAEIGAGTGQLLVWLAQRAARAIGVDRSERMLQICAERLRREGLDNVELRTGQAEKLPLADGECDVVFSSMLLHHLADPAAGIAEMSRIARPDGKVVVSDLAKHDQDWTREVMADLWLGFTPEQIGQWFAAAGLGDVRYSCDPGAGPGRSGSARKLRTFIAIAVKG